MYLVSLHDADLNLYTAPKMNESLYILKRFKWIRRTLKNCERRSNLHMYSSSLETHGDPLALT